MKTTYHIRLKTQGFALAFEFILWSMFTAITFGFGFGVLLWRMVARIAEAVEIVREEA